MEVRSEPGMVPSREPFGVSLQKSPPALSQPSMQNMRLTFASDGTAIYKPVTPGGSSPFQGGTPASSAAAAAATTTTASAAVAPSASGGGGGGEGGGSGAASATPDAHRGPVGGGGGGGGGAGGAGGGGGGGSSLVSSDGSGRPVAPPGFNMNVGEPLKRKRGRPRKYGPDGTMALGLSPGSLGSGGYSTSSFGSATPGSADGMSKPRPRPASSAKKQQLAALGSAGIGFTPHVITVKAGEDVSSKIMSFSQCGPRAVCILSANGAISNVTLRQAATCGGTVTYEGRFEILSLSGSFLYSESGGQRSRTGGLSVSLAGPDGRVLGGGVAGILTAASPVQVVMGSFIADVPRESKPPSYSESPYGPSPTSAAAMPMSPPSHGLQGMPFRSWQTGADLRKEPKQPNLSETTYANKIPPASGMAASGSPGSHGTQSESSGEMDSPLNHSSGTCNNPTQQGMPNLPWK